MLIQQQANVNLPNNSEETPLIRAVQRRDVKRWQVDPAGTAQKNRSQYWR